MKIDSNGSSYTTKTRVELSSCTDYAIRASSAAQGVEMRNERRDRHRLPLFGGNQCKKRILGSLAAARRWKGCISATALTCWTGSQPIRSISTVLIRLTERESWAKNGITKTVTLRPSGARYCECLNRGHLPTSCAVRARTACGERSKNWRPAGFKIDFSPFFWTYATGYPKAHNISKAFKKKDQNDPRFEGAYAGCQPKPAVEVILVAMKPLTEKTYEAQAKANGHGVTWMDDCRIPYSGQSDFAACDKKQKSFHGAKTIGTMTKGNTTFLNGPINVLPPQASPGGRFPANLLVSDDILEQCASQ